MQRKCGGNSSNKITKKGEKKNDAFFLGGGKKYWRKLVELPPVQAPLSIFYFFFLRFTSHKTTPITGTSGITRFCKSQIHLTGIMGFVFF